MANTPPANHALQPPNPAIASLLQASRPAGRVAEPGVVRPLARLLVKTCPKCSAENASDASLCSCGYEFMSEPPFANPPSPPVSRLGHFPSFTVAAILTFVSATVPLPQRPRPFFC